MSVGRLLVYFIVFGLLILSSSLSKSLHTYFYLYDHIFSQTHKLNLLVIFILCQLREERERGKRGKKEENRGADQIRIERLQINITQLDRINLILLSIPGMTIKSALQSSAYIWSFQRFISFNYFSYLVRKCEILHLLIFEFLPIIYYNLKVKYYQTKFILFSDLI